MIIKGNRITPKELEVWRLAASGKVTKEIATELKISDRTVERHRQVLHWKLRCRNVAELTLKAVAYNIVPIPTVILKGLFNNQPVYE